MAGSIIWHVRYLLLTACIICCNNVAVGEVQEKIFVPNKIVEGKRCVG
jgi:hypothetical protein